MELNEAFGVALASVRRKRGLAQEDFSQVSSRTYVSSLERGEKNPTLQKVELLSEQLEIHPLTLLASTFANRDGTSTEQLLKMVTAELKKLSQLEDPGDLRGGSSGRKGKK